jgi:Zn-dependent protease with chaperone function
VPEHIGLTPAQTKESIQMKEDKLAALIRPLETFAAANPRLYRFRVALLASVGYAYLLFILTILLALVAAILIYGDLRTVTVKLVWIPLVLVGLILRALWITIPEPDGQKLEPEQAPTLFALIDEISNALNGPKVDHVLVSDEFNAGIVQIPQFGMFGWLRNYLVVGLPLLRALSPAEFRAVLAHEFGHLSGKHGRFSGWIYRVRQTWVQVLTRVHQERSYASFLFEPFLNWYAPYLNAYSFVLARAQEREADAYAVDLAGKDIAALALTRLTTKNRLLSHDFWPTFFRGANEKPTAPADPFTQMLSGLEQSLGHAKAQKWFLEALRVPTGYDDTHPALADRLQAIGFEKDSPEMASLLQAVINADESNESAASHYLRDVPPEYLQRLNRLWRERIAQPWRHRYDEIAQGRKRLEQFDEESKTRTLTVDELLEVAKLRSDIENEAASVPILQEILKEHPEHVPANFALGMYLLEQKNAEAIPHLELVIKNAPALAADACEMISGFYFEQGDHEMARVFQKRAEQYRENDRKLQDAAMNLSSKDKFVEHDLDDPAVEKLKSELTNVRGLEAAYLVRKVVEGTDSELYVLAVAAAFTWKNGISGKHVDQLFGNLNTVSSMPSPILVLSLDGEHAHLLGTICRVPRATLVATPDFGVKNIAF